MSFAEFIAENLFSVANLTWNATRRVVREGTLIQIASAHFSVENVTVTVEFEEKSHEWFASFETQASPVPKADPHQAFYIFNGVFQAIEEFVEVRQPNVLIVVAKKPAMSNIYETYIRREQVRLDELGYRLESVQRMEPFTEFRLKRVTTADWKDISS